MIAASDPDHLRLQVQRDRAQIQAPPPPRSCPSPAPVITRRAAPAHPTATWRITTLPDRGHDFLGLWVELNRLDHHYPTKCRQTQHMTP